MTTTPTPSTDTAAAGTQPITVHANQGDPLRVQFPDPEVSPLRKVRNLAKKARAWEPVITAGTAAYNEGNWLAAIEAVTPEPQDGVWHTSPDEGDAWDAIDAAESYALGWMQQAHNAELSWLYDALLPKVKIRRTSDDGTFEVRGGGIDLPSLVAALTASGLGAGDLGVALGYTGRRSTGHCTGSCREARQMTCVCSCGGANHSVSVPQNWRLTKVTETPDPENPEDTSWLREYRVTGGS